MFSRMALCVEIEGSTYKYDTSFTTYFFYILYSVSHKLSPRSSAPHPHYIRTPHTYQILSSSTSMLRTYQTRICLWSCMLFMPISYIAYAVFQILDLYVCTYQMPSFLSSSMRHGCFHRRPSPLSSQSWGCLQDSYNPVKRPRFSVEREFLKRGIWVLHSLRTYVRT